MRPIRRRLNGQITLGDSVFRDCLKLDSRKEVNGISRFPSLPPPFREPSENESRELPGSRSLHADLDDNFIGSNISNVWR